MSVTRKRNRKSATKRKTYSKKDYKSGDGMLTTVWGPSMWHFLHTMSFNYPVKPTEVDKKNYRKFLLSLQHVLPCGHCRKNLKNNFKVLPLRDEDLENRNKFSRYIFRLHELINKMLGKKSGLKYCDVRDTYEHFRSRCSTSDDIWDMKKIKEAVKSNKKEEKGCTVPLYGQKAKCIIKIVPQSDPGKTFQLDERCIKKRLD